ncbi:hypothetical protein QQ045_011566 [Rhodiola kirilowii]
MDPKIGMEDIHGIQPSIYTYNQNHKKQLLYGMRVLGQHVNSEKQGRNDYQWHWRSDNGAQACQFVISAAFTALGRSCLLAKTSRTASHHSVIILAFLASLKIQCA